MFVGAAWQFCGLFAVLKETQLELRATKLDIKRTFNPPGGLLFAGVWELLVGSFKDAKWNILWSRSPIEQQLTTAICSVEQLINNKPLIASSSDAADLETFILNQFVSGCSTIDYPNVILNGGSAAMETAFCAHSQNMQKTWNSWINDHLPKLTSRKTRVTDEKQLMIVGKLVWVCDKQYCFFNYPMGEIWELHIGEVGLSRRN